MICKVIFVNSITGEYHDKIFYGRECDVDAANFLSLNPELKLVSCEIIKD